MLNRLVNSHSYKMTKVLTNNFKSLVTNSLEHHKFPCFIPPHLINSSIYASNRNGENKCELDQHCQEKVSCVRNELYPATPSFGAHEFSSLERAAALYFGMKAYGVHINGYVEREGQNFLWLGKRSQMKPTYPGMLDHLVAGGLPHGIPCGENMMKECVKEARIPRPLSQRVKPVWAVSYTPVRSISYTPVRAVSYTPVRAISYTPVRAVSYKDLHEPRVKGKARSNSRSRALDNCPQKQGICLRLITRSPKKPNSAVRKLAKVRLSNRRNVLSYIPGEGHSLQEHSVVLVRGGRVKDLPGVKFHCIRGVKDLLGIPTRRRGRSKYGSPKPKSA